MGLRSLLARPFAAWVVSQHKKVDSNPIGYQHRVLKNLLRKASQTVFGLEHDFAQISTPEQFAERVPLRDYEELRPWIEKMTAGEPDILWPGKPTYLAKTSGTTSGVKYIPLSKDSIPHHIAGARDALLFYVNETGKAGFLDKKLIFLSGSPALEEKNGLKVGRLSGIVNHHIPGYLRTNQLPCDATNRIDDWEQKLDAIIDETLGQPMSLISGIPPWVQMYFDRMKARTGKLAGEVFPDFQLFVYGGVNFEPYRRQLSESIGRPIDSVELFPASEGFFAFQDRQGKPGMRLLLNAGIYYEFIPQDDLGQEKPRRLHIGQVEKGQTYALVISNNAGLWAYQMGDLVQFVNLKPHRVIVAGRVNHFISAFGEHVIGTEVEQAMTYAQELFPTVSLSEFTVAPVVVNDEGLPHHQWLVEFNQAPHNLPAFERELNERMIKLNIYYKDLLVGNILEPLQIVSLPPGTFAAYMRSQGKLGGQNKVPRLANDRKLADALLALSTTL
jgi:hypothetical protein